ncbi:GntR family transcriptional regulator [Mycolicibacterium vaccae]|jgi:DNA-binding GntR family transcriptional regulator|uniref:GntR family transcriptional regulator n=1 Tax=Mycolicibacterium vaccae ATCC 25954 TaxID=1194972 RepID=K0UVR7_MYCVA|nr:GntR family transcriptional regulator [Mycolicibacterium vaccae]EJZ09140.1 GntR family transcriptional regulator [Mycolicibacterium vaccae ATCC 25954]MCV7061635.1 GntR family transcriptional regulator [Mycolicibacterium vaccae]
MTRTTEVYDTLLAELLNGQLAPGQKLLLVAIGERLGVSQSVVREALTRLAAQGFVVATPQRGFRVRELSVDDIVCLTETRVQVETAALRLAIQRGDVHWEAGILTSHHLLDQTPFFAEDRTVNEEWNVRHREFHRALLAGCKNPWMDRVTQAMRDNAELYRRWYLVLADGHPHDFAIEHDKLKDLALARDVDAAVALLTEHIERAPRELIAYATEHGVEGFQG